MNKNKGFSLVELIVVIAIMAVLVGIIAPQFLGYVEKAKKSVAITNCETVVKTAEVYMTDTGDTDLESPYTEIKEKSNAKGVINEIQNNSSSVTYLKYTEEYVVVYQNGIYTIEGEADSNEGDVTSVVGYTMTDIDGVSHVFVESLTNEDFVESVNSSNNGGISLPSGTVLKEGDNYYIVGYSGWFGKSNTNKNISEYSNVIKLSGDKIYTASDKVNETWPNYLPTGTVCYYGGKYYVSPNGANKNTFPPGGWLEIKQ